MSSSNPVFDYRTLRLLMGLIALLLPFIVYFVSKDPDLPSISFSYYTDSRDMFVGMLFIVGSFLFAYNGHYDSQSKLSKAAAIAAILVAIFPTSCAGCPSSIVSYIHFISAITLFSILAYFCFVIFRIKTKGQPGKKGRRSKIYLTCGLIMVACMLVMLISFKLLTPEELDHSRIIFFGEGIALIAFGVAWIVSGKSFKFVADEEEIFHPFKKPG